MIQPPNPVYLDLCLLPPAIPALSASLSSAFSLVSGWSGANARAVRLRHDESSTPNSAKKELVGGGGTVPALLTWEAPSCPTSPGWLSPTPASATDLVMFLHPAGLLLFKLQPLVGSISPVPLTTLTMSTNDLPLLISVIWGISSPWHRGPLLLPWLHPSQGSPRREGDNIYTPDDCEMRDRPRRPGRPLTLCPLTPGRPGVPGKPRAP